MNIGVKGRRGKTNFNRIFKKDHSEKVTSELRPKGGEETKHINTGRDGYSSSNE